MHIINTLQQPHSHYSLVKAPTEPLVLPLKAQDTVTLTKPRVGETNIAEAFGTFLDNKFNFYFIISVITAIGGNQLIEHLKTKHTQTKANTLIHNDIVQSNKNRSGINLDFLTPVKDYAIHITDQANTEKLSEKLLEKLAEGLGHIKTAQSYSSETKESRKKIYLALLKAQEKLNSINTNLPPHLGAMVELGLLQVTKGLTETNPARELTKKDIRTLRWLLPKDDSQSFTNRIKKTIVNVLTHDNPKRQQYFQTLKNSVNGLKLVPESSTLGLFKQATKALNLVNESMDLVGSFYVQYSPVYGSYTPTPVKIDETVQPISTIVANTAKGVCVDFGNPEVWMINKENTKARYPSLMDIQTGSTLAKYPKGLIDVTAQRLFSQVTGSKKTNPNYAFINRHLPAFKITYVGHEYIQDPISNFASWFTGIGRPEMNYTHFRFEYNPESVEAQVLKLLGLEHHVAKFIPNTDAGFRAKLNLSDFTSLTAEATAKEIAKQLSVTHTPMPISWDTAVQRAKNNDVRQY